MTVRLPEGPVRATNWLAGWMDYTFAIALVAGRWLRAPIARASDEPVMMAAFAPAMADGYAPQWHTPGQERKSGAFVRIAEIVMLSVSFFLAAHLLAGGTQTVSAPDLNPLGLLSEHARAETQAVPVVATREVQVDAGSFVVEAALQPAAEPPVVVAEAAPALPATDTHADVTAAGATPVPAPVTPAVTAPAAAADSGAAVSPSIEDRRLTSDELRAAAVTAGWPADLLPDLETVAWCESRNHTHAQNMGALGIMQLLPYWFKFTGAEKSMWADPVTNLRVAWLAYLETERINGDPWSAWACRPS